MKKTRSGTQEKSKTLMLLQFKLPQLWSLFVVQFPRKLEIKLQLLDSVLSEKVGNFFKKLL